MICCRAQRALTDFTFKLSRTEKELYEEFLKTEEAEILAETQRHFAQAKQKAGVVRFDDQSLWSRIGCLVRGNEHDGICNFFGSADALVRNLCLEEICFVFLRLRKAVKHSGFPRTRANDVDTNACAGEFDGRRLRDAFHGVLAADIHRCGRAADFAVRRRDVDDAAFTLAKHGLNLVLHAEEHTKHIRVEDSLIALGGYVSSGTGSADGASVIDGNVETTETSGGLVDE